MQLTLLTPCAVENIDTQYSCNVNTVTQCAFDTIDTVETVETRLLTLLTPY